MKEIILHGGKIAMVDNEDFDRLNNSKWFCKNVNDSGKLFYARNKKGYMHRQIINVPDGLQVDHINGNGLDNQKSNLRIVTRRQNHWNRSNQGEFISVTKHNDHKFQSRIRINNIKRTIGTYRTPQEGEAAYFLFYDLFKESNNFELSKSMVNSRLDLLKVEGSARRSVKTEAKS